MIGAIRATPRAERLPDDMARFIDWCNTETDLDPVLKAAITHFWFVTIHPFEDGNGRIARGLAEMMLARGDGCRDRFYGMSTQIECEKKEYYRTLELSQRGDLDITRWMAWFLGCLDRAVHDSVTSSTAGSSSRIQPGAEARAIVLPKSDAHIQFSGGEACEPEISGDF